jgi:hypothetical protein
LLWQLLLRLKLSTNHTLISSFCQGDITQNENSRHFEIGAGQGD